MEPLKLLVIPWNNENLNPNPNQGQPLEGAVGAMEGAWVFGKGTRSQSQVKTREEICETPH